ncbi:MAG: dihydropteroate synthase [Gammaproteobacteria bacterium]|nr:dihydropteroate synthase [Gammaproteobacteria bacterium]
MNSPRIMGVINISPDSFYKGSRCQNAEQALKLAEQMQRNGADIIDIGGEATNPKLDIGLSKVSIAQELDRVIRVVEAIKSRLDIGISIDTSKPEVMQAAVKAGASMINDQRALTQAGALEMAASLQVPVCLMHMFSLNRQPNADAAKTLFEIQAYLQARINACLAAGLKQENIIIDPGFGHGNYGKSTAENWYILKHLKQLCALGYPVMVGLSRKTMIGELLNIPIEERLAGSLALAILAAVNGAEIIRVHDVLETVQAIKMIRAVLD